MTDYTRLDADDRALCRSLRREGQSLRDIAESVGCSETAVKHAIEAKDYAPRPHFAARPHAFADVAGKIMGGR